MAEQKEGIVVMEPGDKAQAKLEVKIAESEFANDLTQLLSTQGGRRYMWQLLAETGMMEDTFCGEETHRSAYKAGMARIGRKIFTDLLTHVPSLYNQMAAENSGQNQKGKKQ